MARDMMSRRNGVGRGVLAWWLAGALALLFPALAVMLPTVLAVQVARWRTRRRRRQRLSHYADRRPS